jgi:5-oxoprolinase (ATP-hydrolysing) subunit A
MAATIDINCDMGESFGRWSLGDDAGIMPHISSANIATGWHGGDPGVMRATVALAKEHGVGIGAHCGLPDLLGFGRRQISVSPQETRDYILYQYGALRAFADAAGAKVEHLKPHGAFYVMINRDPELTDALIEAVGEADPDLVVVLMESAAVDRVAAAGVRVVPEAFPDLDYNPDGTLILERAKRPREPRLVAERILRVVRENRLRAADGTDLDVSARTFCIHGDSPNAVDVGRGVRELLSAEGIRVAPLQSVEGVPGSASTS